MSNILTKAISTKTSRTFRSGDNWAKRDIHTDITIPCDLSFAQQHYLRMSSYLEESLAVYNALKIFDGIIEANQYNEILSSLNENFTELRKTIGNTTYCLVLVEDGDIKDVLNFDDVVQFHIFCKTYLNCEPSQLSNISLINPKFAGTKLFEKKFIKDPTEVINSLKQGY